MVGIASADSLSGAPAGHGPTDILKEARSVIVIAVKLLRSVVDTAPSMVYYAHYITVNRALDEIAGRIARFLEDKGFRAIPIPASWPYHEDKHMGIFSHRHAAVEAGLGEIGMSSLLVVPIHGPRIRLASVITDAPLRPDGRMGGPICTKCMKCVKACPALALAADGIIYKQKCLDYMKSIGLAEVCGICVRVCEVGL